MKTMQALVPHFGSIGSMSESETGKKTMSQTPPTKVDRKVIEKNRRNQMKTLYSHLNSLVPSGTFKEVLPVPDQIDEAINYIKCLEAGLKVLRAKKENLLLLLAGSSPTKKRPYKNYIGTNYVSQQQNALLSEAPRIDIRVNDSSLEIILMTQLDNQFIFCDVVRVLQEEGLQLLGANYSGTSKGSIIHVLHAQMGDSSLGFGAVKVTERLNRLVNGFMSDHALMSQPELWDFDTTWEF